MKKQLKMPFQKVKTGSELKVVALFSKNKLFCYFKAVFQLYKANKIDKNMNVRNKNREEGYVSKTSYDFK